VPNLSISQCVGTFSARLLVVPHLVQRKHGHVREMPRLGQRLLQWALSKVKSTGIPPQPPIRKSEETHLLRRGYKPPNPPEIRGRTLQSNSSPQSNPSPTKLSPQRKPQPEDTSVRSHRHEDSSCPMPAFTPYSQLTPAPWKHPSELAMVRDWFYPEHVSRSIFDFRSSQVDQRQDAINLVSLWQFRDPKLTHALISTAHLTDAMLHDQPGKRENFSSLALRSIYAMNFCRFVNALVDRDVRRSAIATIAKEPIAAESDVASGPHRGQSSMYAHALKLGLPDNFVELRHQAVHEEMPSLEVLRVRTGEALEWLWDRWWKVNVNVGAEPALSAWKEKHRPSQTSVGQAKVEEEDLRADQSVLCQRCRKRKRFDDDDGNGDDPNFREEAEEESLNPDRPKQQELDTEQENHVSSPQEQRKWALHFYTGLPDWRETSGLHQQKAQSPQTTLISATSTSAGTSEARPPLKP